ncbi:MAG: hypothetical protein K9J21_07080 [Bacteroidales bacterium]|nr:hypothetical protein [Bacteroidales bacterium]
MHKRQLYNLIEETLVDLADRSGWNLNGREAVQLVGGTIAIESRMGYYIQQIKGPALGISQIELASFKSLVDNFLYYKPELTNAIREVCNINDFNKEALIYNLKFSICMTRVKYLTDPNPLPKPGQMDTMAGYYKRVYNTPKGKATKRKFKRYFKKYILWQK